MRSDKSSKGESWQSNVDLRNPGSVIATHQLPEIGLTRPSHEIDDQPIESVGLIPLHPVGALVK
jgi:hypothetical protein